MSPFRSARRRDLSILLAGFVVLSALGLKFGDKVFGWACVAVSVWAITLSYCLATKG